ncbi:MAG: response regulator [Alphaproteobacteria bacterium]|nr:response regulator [Alphaproteobacteria bacterium]
MMNVAEHQDAIYAYIGQRIRERRKLLKLSQTELAELMGFSYQQMQKYETGISHVSAGKLLLFAKILNVPPNYFYEGLNLEGSFGTQIDETVIQKKQAKPFSIVLIEDNPADVILFKKALTECGYEVDVHIFHESDSALDFLHNYETKFHNRRPDLVVLDLSLPKKNGMGLLKTIKKNSSLQSIPIIILTNSISLKDMVEAYRHGAAGFIQKSVDLSEYMDYIAVVIKYWSKVVVLPRS